jgi:hypothetical protein
MIDACLIEISRRTKTEGLIYERAYGCREHAAEIANELVHRLASWTYWGRSEDEVEIVKTTEEEPVNDEEE